jgi:protocatechuate 3,4-dioxygenase beta subunit
VLTGIVLSVDCLPLAGAQVQLWQSNRLGRYTRAGSATVVTDRAGRFQFEGPRPVSYEGREPHIHLRVIARDHEDLVTRYVPARTATRGSVRLVLAPARL